MSRRSLLVLAGLLGLIAFGAMGYTAWAERQKRIDLQASYDSLWSRNAELRRQVSSYEDDIYYELLSEETEALLEQIVMADERSQRARLAQDLDLALLEFYVEYGAAVEVFVRLEQLVNAPIQSDREEIRDRFLSKVEDMSDLNLEAPVVIDEGLTAKTLSTVITSLIALGTALGSVVTFFMGGTERRVDDALAEVQLEKAKIELAQMRYDAREALEYRQSKTAEDPS